MQADVLRKKMEINTLFLIQRSCAQRSCTLQMKRVKLLKKCSEVWDEIKNKIKAINGNKKNDYGKDYMKIKFNPDDDLPLSKSLTFHAMTINIRFVFNKMVNYIRKFF